MRSALTQHVLTVLDSDEVNAFALPGGFFFVNSGLNAKADNEAELAGGMAHEIAHVAARHGTRQATGTIINSAGVVMPLGFLTFSRGFESEADMLGLQYMYKPQDLGCNRSGDAGRSSDPESLPWRPLVNEIVVFRQHATADNGRLFRRVVRRRYLRIPYRTVK